MIACRVTGVCSTSEASPVSTGIVVVETEVRIRDCIYLLRSCSLTSTRYFGSSDTTHLPGRTSPSLRSTISLSPLPRVKTSNIHTSNRDHHLPPNSSSAHFSSGNFAMASRQITLQIHHNTPRAALFMIWLEEAVKQTSGEVALLRADGKPFLNDVAASQWRQRDRADSGVGLALTSNGGTVAVRR